MKKPVEPKPLFLERMKSLLPDEKDYKKYLETLDTEPKKAIRCNTLKISPKELKHRLESKGWEIKQPFKKHPEIMIIENSLQPGELGRALEHMLGYYYVQEIASMLPVIALDPKPNERVLDLCASPGSKTTQIASAMKNTGTIIANEVSLGRLKVLAANTERCGVTNTVLTKKEGSSLCYWLKEERFFFDKILIDAPCSGEGTLRTSPITAKMWNINTVRKLSKVQRNLVASAVELLRVDGELVYSTCTHAPEENEAVVNYILEEFSDELKIETIKLPIECRPGLEEWQGNGFEDSVLRTCRIYPQDNDTEGFFIAKFKKIK